ncbi:UNKNOWN [Stylonychia lemnae]|uniref:Uncharacterized protein n=1 Tax=Stylonychia lemnae TaxID=5949 RepID=A0A078B1V8_STYLE|nr:UNKNOWN [Stylonychia lemnae]|eukprot:CDW87303.1 UNKNOWN [Stylonychia lemnae]
MNKRNILSRWEELKHKFKYIDLFAQPVQLTFKGEDTYKTMIGAVSSLMLIMLLLSYGVFKAVFMFNRMNPSVQKVSLLRDMSDGLIFKPQDLGFDFAFGLSQNLEPSIGYFTVRQQVIFETDMIDDQGKIVIEKLKRDVKFSKCQRKHLNHTNQADVVANGISNFYCIEDNTYQFSGNYYQRTFEYVEIKLWKCQNQSSPNAINNNQKVVCQDKKIIDQFFDNDTFSFAYVNTFFDQNNFNEEKQFKKFVDDSLFFHLESQRIKKANFYIQLQEANMQDDYIQFGQAHNYKFFHVENIRTYDDSYTEEDGNVVTVYLRLDNHYDVYQRKIYSILELLAELGGLYRSLFTIGLLFIGLIAQKLFLIDIMHSTYQVRKILNHDDENCKHGLIFDRKKGFVLKPSSPKKNNNEFQKQKVDSSVFKSPKAGNKVDLSLKFKYQSPKAAADLDFDDNVQQTERIQTDRDELGVFQTNHQDSFRFLKELRSQDVKDLLRSFIYRMRFTYSYKLLFIYILRCFCCRDLRKSKSHHSFKMHYLYQKGEEKLGMDLDVVQLVKTLRQFKLLSQAILSQQHRMLLRFQRQSLIETSSDSSDSDDNHLDPLRLIESPNPIIRLVTLGKLKRMMKSLRGKKIQKIERNLLRGVFQRKIKDYEEDQRQRNKQMTLIQKLYQQNDILDTEQNYQDEVSNHIFHSQSNLGENVIEEFEEDIPEKNFITKDFVKSSQLRAFEKQY